MTTDPRVRIVPSALIYIDEQSAGSPNCRRRSPFCYVDQAITLNRSLLALGLPQLTIVTNVPDDIERHLMNFGHDMRPRLVPVSPSITLPKSTRFYSAHFKLDLLEQAGRSLPKDALLMLLDTDMVALLPLDVDLLRRCQATGVGAFDISDQEFSAYGNARVMADLETVAGRRLANPRWFGGELLLASAGVIEELVPCARECFHRYIGSMPELNHHGDEVFMSAALNLLCERGHQVIDVGAHRLVGRHWSGNTHRDLRWFRGCSLLHLPGCKELLERQARRDTFSAARLWDQLVLMHTFNRFVWPLRQRVHARRRGHYTQDRKTRAAGQAH
ncbi:response regulator receiver protein [Paraburkholderia sp. BL23I1N1]|uniref:response regulator receiver protein n=1 Tax=Paraburkholderia sp. BL23I1N1 TaxID=1938802 RepID=UPI0011C361AF|nr:response regulator receiver protein [Paraburkholderia sp. BL23I1N1]